MADLGVGEGPEPVVVLLAGRVEQAEGVGLAADHHRHRVVVEDLRQAVDGDGGVGGGLTVGTYSEGNLLVV